MAYVSKVWVDRQSEYPTRRILKYADGSDDQVVTVERAEVHPLFLWDRFYYA